MISQRWFFLLPCLFHNLLYVYMVSSPLAFTGNDIGNVPEVENKRERRLSWF
jgi:hypothetical protein